LKKNFIITMVVSIILLLPLCFSAVQADDGEDQSSVNLTVEIVTPPITGGGFYIPVSPTISIDCLGVSHNVAVGTDGRTQDTTIISVPNSGLEVTFPAGTLALDSDGQPLTDLTIDDGTDIPPLPNDGFFVTLPFELGPSGATFDPPLIFTWEYDPGALPEGVSPVIVYWTGTEWVELIGVVDIENGIVTAEVSHFTIFALVYADVVVMPAPLPVKPKPEPEPITPEPEPMTPEDTDEPIVVDEEDTTVDDVVVTATPEYTEPESTNWLMFLSPIVVSVIFVIYIIWLWRKRRIENKNSKTEE